MAQNLKEEKQFVVFLRKGEKKITKEEEFGGLLITHLGMHVLTRQKTMLSISRGDRICITA